MAMRQHNGEQHDDSQRNTFYRIQEIQFSTTNSLFYIKRAWCLALLYLEVFSMKLCLNFANSFLTQILELCSWNFRSMCVSKQNNAISPFSLRSFLGGLREWVKHRIGWHCFWGFDNILTCPSTLFCVSVYKHFWRQSRFVSFVKRSD